jgi:hypothetical protein
MDTTNPLLTRQESFARTADAAMDLNGTVNKTGILLLICGATAAFGWYTPALQGPLILAPLLGALVFCMVGIFKPATSPFVAPCYAALEGLVLGAISGVMNQRYQGIVANAVLLTFAVLALFLFLYATRIVRVTNGMRVAVIAATGAIFVVYMIDMDPALLRRFRSFPLQQRLAGHWRQPCGLRHRRLQFLPGFRRHRRIHPVRFPKVYGMVLRHGSAHHPGLALSGNPAPPEQAPESEMTRQSISQGTKSAVPRKNPTFIWHFFGGDARMTLPW